MTFRLMSKQLVDGNVIPMEHVAHAFGYKGGNRSPQLAWEGAPAATKSFVVTAYDPDAPTGSGFWHWSIIDIPPETVELPGGIMAASALPHRSRQTRNHMGTRDYIGAAPPPGPPHRYVFTVHALSIAELPVPDDASGALVGWMVNSNLLAKASLTVTFGSAT